MKTNNNFDLNDYRVSELTTEEQKIVIGGAESVFYYIGWGIGAAIAMPILVVAAATLAVVATVNSGYQGSSERLA